jgi:hypothetical protein
VRTAVLHPDARTDFHALRSDEGQAAAVLIASTSGARRRKRRPTIFRQACWMDWKDRLEAHRVVLCGRQNAGMAQDEKPKFARR